jgi:glycosyltransferase involved in cell wall biosynthesis
MPVHNALPHLDAAIRSILEQTHRDFEFVILDDASTDGSMERLKEWAAKDARIRLHLGKKNLGPAASSNFVVREAKGTLIARMDADDISHSDRLRLQLEILREYPEAGLVGSLSDVIDERGRQVRGPDPWRLQHSGWFAPFPHGSIMYRRELFERAGGYREQCVYWEDLDLFLRIAGFAKVLTIPEPLYRHRHSHSSTRLDSRQTERIERATDLMYHCVEALDSGTDYEALLTERTETTKVDPRVFRARGSIVLWSGHRPRLLKRLLQRGKLQPDLKTILALGWAGLAALSPAVLRLALKGIAWSRNSASRSDAEKDVVEWRLPRPLPIKGQATPVSKHDRKSQAS